MGIRLEKPWTPLTEESIAALPAQLGVYQIADADSQVTKIGYAGGGAAFGMRSVLTNELANGGVNFRHEFTHSYMTRWQELLMIHAADHGQVPALNASDTHRIGRLSIEGAL